MTSATPDGWYPDPGGSAQHRWWDGQAWTNDLRLVNQPPTPWPIDSPSWTAPPQQGSAQGEYPQHTLGYGDQTFGGATAGPVGHSVADVNRNVFTGSVCNQAVSRSARSMARVGGLGTSLCSITPVPKLLG